MQEAGGSYFPLLMKTMNGLRKDKILFDVRIVFGVQEVPAHKCILVASSDYFKSLFLGPVKTDEDKVDLSSVALDFESVEAVIEFLYTGKIIIDDENLEALLKLSTYLLLTEIVNICKAYMKGSTALESYLNYYLLSVVYMLPEHDQYTLAATVQSRFHDFFIFDASTKAISPIHLKHLMERNNNMFKHVCVQDILSFVTDWVLNGKTEEHELLGTEILEIVETRSKGDEPAQESYQAIEEIREKLDSNGTCPEFVENLKRIIDKYLTVKTVGIHVDAATAVVEKVDKSKETSENLDEQMTEPDTEQVVIAFAPKKRLQDFFDIGARECSCEHNEGIYDLCVYIPRQNAWYYLAEGPNNSVFKNIGMRTAAVSGTISINSRICKAVSHSDWTLNFCMLDKICCVSLVESTLCMYHLRQHAWESVNYKHLVTHYPNLDKTNDVRFCCKDGETLYLILRKQVYPENTGGKISFTCYKLGAQTFWFWVFQTPYILESEDSLLDRSKFDVCLSQDGTRMFIANEGKMIHMFVANLEAPASELNRFLVSFDGTEVDRYWMLQNEVDRILMLQNEGHVFVVDEEFYGRYDSMHYRSRLLDVFKDPDSSEVDDGYESYDEIQFDIPHPDDEKLHSLSKHFRSACDSKSVWVFLGDGKFENSLDEIVPKHGGCMELIEHIPPPFSTVTLMAAGRVRSKHLANLKRLK